MSSRKTTPGKTGTTAPLKSSDYLRGHEVCKQLGITKEALDEMVFHGLVEPKKKKNVPVSWQFDKKDINSRLRRAWNELQEARTNEKLADEVEDEWKY